MALQNPSISEDSYTKAFSNIYTYIKTALEKKVPLSFHTIFNVSTVTRKTKSKHIIGTVFVEAWYLFCFAVKCTALCFFSAAETWQGYFGCLCEMCAGAWVLSGLLALTGSGAHRHPSSAILQSTSHRTVQWSPCVPAGFKVRTPHTLRDILNKCVCFEHRVPASCTVLYMHQRT